MSVVHPPGRFAVLLGREAAGCSPFGHAGQPHRGKTTESEKQLVRDHLDEINERLAALGLRTISLTDPGDAERHGLEQLASGPGVGAG